MNLNAVILTNPRSLAFITGSFPAVSGNGSIDKKSYIIIGSRESPATVG